jgi:hypothetical protein
LKTIFCILFFISINCIGTSRLFSQTDSTDIADEIIVNGIHYKAVDEKKIVPVKKKKIEKLVDSIFVINNNKFEYYNNWVTFGLGGQQNITYQRNLGFVGVVDCNFHIKHQYFQAGALLSGNSFGSYNNYELHLGYGRRFEDKDYHFAAFLDITYSAGYQLTQIDSITYTTRYSRRNYNQPGLLLQGEVVKKITYDVGIGACLFVDWNQEQSMIGLRFILYFSGSYTGKRYKEIEE